MNRSLSSNIPKYYAYLFLDGLQFFIPIYIVFLLDKGLSFSQVMLLEGIYSIMAVVLEVPTGYFADVKGRKSSLVISSLGFIFAFTVFAFGQNFLHFAISMVVWAVAGSFRSGADNAFLYDTLKSTGREKDYPKMAGRAGSVSMVALTTASLAGGWLAGISMALPFIATVAVGAASLYVALLFREPPRKKLIVEKGHVRKLVEIAQFVLRKKSLSYLMAYRIFLIPAMIVMFYLVQPYLVELGLPPFALGVMYAVITLAGAAGMMAGPRLYNKIRVGPQLLAFALIAGISIALMAAAKSYAGLAALIVVAVVFGAVEIAFQSTVNRQVSSDKRATVLSLANMLLLAGLGAFSVMSGPLLDAYGLRTALLMAAAVLAAGCSVFALLLTSLKVDTDS